MGKCRRIWLGFGPFDDRGTYVGRGAESHQWVFACCRPAAPLGSNLYCHDRTTPDRRSEMPVAQSLRAGSVAKKQPQQNDHRDRHAQQPKQKSSSHLHSPQFRCPQMELGKPGPVPSLAINVERSCADVSDEACEPAYNSAHGRSSAACRVLTSIRSALGSATCHWTQTPSLSALHPVHDDARWLGVLSGMGSGFPSMIAHAGARLFQFYVMPKGLDRSALCDNEPHEDVGVPAAARGRLHPNSSYFNGRNAVSARRNRVGRCSQNHGTSCKSARRSKRCIGRLAPRADCRSARRH